MSGYCHIHPMRQITFVEWCKKLVPIMQAADSFNLITQSKLIDEYTLIPSLWQVMPPIDKKTSVAIVEHFGKDAWSVECCGELIKSLKISLAVSLLLFVTLCILIEASKKSSTK
jgi:hypothetical protein